MSSFRIGLTGGLASGKSTVAGRLTELGFEVVDADQIVADLYAPGEPGARVVSELFGANYLAKGGGVDKPRLARLVFADDAARTKLEGVIHPLVRAFFSRLATARVSPIVLEATRLVEAGYSPDFDLIVTVESAPDLQIERAVARGLSRDEAIRRLAAQGDGEERRTAAQRVIENNGTLAELEAKVDRLVGEIRERAR